MDLRGRDGSAAPTLAGTVSMLGAGPDLSRESDLIVLSGTAFFISDGDGNVGSTGPRGYFHDDVRHLSSWELLAAGRRLIPVTARTVDHFSARIVLAPTTTAPAYSVRRDRFVAQGVHEDLTIMSHHADRQRLTLELRFGADFADVMEVREGTSVAPAGATIDHERKTVTLRTSLDGFEAGTQLRIGGATELHEDRAVFQVDLPAQGLWTTCVEIIALRDGNRARPMLSCGSFRARDPEMPLSRAEFIERAPTLETTDSDLRRTYEASLDDLAALRLRPGLGLRHAMPAGGMPWYMAVFGRDSIIAAYEALPFQPTLAAATLRGLAELQAHAWDDRHDAEPGKLPHELRRGRLVALGSSPRDPYYGTHDATPLWLILLDEYERWTADEELVTALESTARGALAWLDRYADPDGDGFLEYSSRSTEGLRNQCWKDSDDAIRFADGRCADPPIGTCELQGYAYDARLRAARLLRERWGDEAEARRHEAAANRLRRRFNERFWNADRNSFLLALAGRPPKQAVDAQTSNPGHLLWSGIVDEELAPAVVSSLLAPDMFTGWGVRSMSADDAGFNPLGYHTGSVWPHDSAIIAAGMRRYGFDAEAAAVIGGLLDAATAFQHHVPEVFAGFQRDRADVPVRYPEALRPQAWAAGAPLLAIRTTLGLTIVDGEPRTDPLPLPGRPPVSLSGLRAGRPPVGHR